MSAELKNFLNDRGVSMSHSAPYHPTGKSQCERFVGLVWKAIMLCLHSHRLDSKDWECVLDTALHSLRSLLCTSTGQTPHERIFSFPRRTSVGCHIPAWLLNPGPVLLRKHARRKDESPVDEVELLRANPSHAVVRFPNGRESSVPLSDLAPLLTSEAVETPQTIMPTVDRETPPTTLLEPRTDPPNTVPPVSPPAISTTGESPQTPNAIRNRP